MKSTKIILTALVVAGVAGTIPAVSAKKHHKSHHSISMKKGSMSEGGMAGSGMSGGGTEKSQGSSQGNVGPGTMPNK